MTLTPEVHDDVDAVILAGGRGSRLGGLRKPELTMRGQRLVDLALTAVADAGRRVVVGDVDLPDGLANTVLTREDPPYTGPVEALAAGLALLPDPAPWIVVLAADLPDVVAAMARLRAALAEGEGVGAAMGGEPCDGYCLLDGDGRLQWLLGVYRSGPLTARLAARHDPPIRAMYRLLEPLRLRGIPAADASVEDVDTAEDARRWGITLPGG